jgi:hypothetical protein
MRKKWRFCSKTGAPGVPPGSKMPGELIREKAKTVPSLAISEIFPENSALSVFTIKTACRLTKNLSMEPVPKHG